MPISGTYLTTGAGAAVGQREDLSDVIERIDPEEVPFQSNANKGTCKAIQTDWQVQELESANNANKFGEGFDATFSALKPTDRLANVCQILAKTGIVSDTLDAVDKAGRAEETAYQKVLKGLELRRDLEAVLLGTGVKSLTDPRSLSAFITWISNAQVGATGAAPAGTGAGAGTAGTPRAISGTLVIDAMQAAYTDGGKPSMMLMSPKHKRQFSALGDTSLGAVATNYLQTGTGNAVTKVGTVGFYLTDFGKLETVIDIFAPDGTVYLIDTRYVKVVTLPGRNFVKNDLAKTGSAKKFMIEWEGTLVVGAPKAHAAVMACN